MFLGLGRNLGTRFFGGQSCCKRIRVISFSKIAFYRELHLYNLVSIAIEKAFSNIVMSASSELCVIPKVCLES